MSVARDIRRAYAPSSHFFLFVCCVICCAVFLSPCAAGQGINVSLSPKEIFVGDTAVMTYIERDVPEASFPSSVFIVPPDDIAAQSSSVSVRQIRVIPAGGVCLCEITFVPWEVGEVSLPAFFIDRDAGVQSVPAAVQVSSLVGKYGITALSEDRPPMLAPGTRLLLYALVLLAVLGVVCAGFFVHRFFYSSDADCIQMPIKKVKKRVLKNLRKLKKNLSESEQLEWYVQYASAVRAFFCDMTGDEKYLAADAREISLLLAEMRNIKSESEKNEHTKTDEICALFFASADALQSAYKQIERIRFSGQAVAGDARAMHLQCLEEFASLFFSLAKLKPLLQNNERRDAHVLV